MRSLVRTSNRRGAVTADMTGPQPVIGGANPAQFASLTADTDLVTVGGVDRLSARVDALAPAIDSVIQGVHRRSPHAVVVVVGHLPVLPAAWGCSSL